jgi:nucleotide-binding universal stress UspA family protein
VVAIKAIPRIALRKIVVATDFTETSKAAVDCAIAIATHYGSKIILVHAVEGVPQPQSHAATVQPGVRALTDAEWHLRLEVTKCADLDCEWHLLRGTAPDVVDQFLAISDVDLIVVGGHERHGFRKAAAEDIFRRVRCPVLAVGPSVRKQEETWNPRRIVVATDLQSDERVTMAYAAALALEHDARLALLHITLPILSPYAADSELIIRPYYESRLQQLMHDWPNDSARPEVWLEFQRDAVAGIVDAVTRKEVDLLILSVHPNAPLTLHFRHSAYRIVSKVPCPTLIVQRAL